MTVNKGHCCFCIYKLKESPGFASCSLDIKAIHLIGLVGMQNNEEVDVATPNVTPVYKLRLLLESGYMDTWITDPDIKEAGSVTIGFPPSAQQPDRILRLNDEVVGNLCLVHLCSDSANAIRKMIQLFEKGE